MKKYQVKVSRSAADELTRQFENNLLQSIKSIDEDSNEDNFNDPRGADDITILLLTFVSQAAATITVEAVKAYLGSRLNRLDVLDVVEQNEESEISDT